MAPSTLSTITTNQMRRLQTLYSQYAAHAIDGNSRDARMAWASEQTGRAIASFKDLVFAEAQHLIDALQAQLGTAPTKPRPRRQRLSRDAAQKAGTEGRRGNESNDVTMAGPAEFARIQYALDQLSWSQSQLEAWLRSSRSPLGKRTQPQIRTLRDANRVWWALKGMMDARKGRV
jgi:hypothetical protein